MVGHGIIVIGASAGGVEALCKLVKDLPENFPAAIFVVLHVPSHGTSVLPQILNRAGRLKAVHPQDSETIQPGRIYVAPPDFHLLLKKGYIQLSRGPRENGHRPAVDPLFRTAARTYGRRVIGVVLSGSLDDGTAGVMAIKMRGGIAVVQNPEDALFSGMPTNAIENTDVDYILRLSEISPLLVKLASEPVGEKEYPVSDEMEIESDVAEFDMNALQSKDRPGTPSGFACPDCGGALWELKKDNLLRFRCRVGHAFSAKTLLAQQSEQLEEALWIALRALEESSALAQRMARRARERNHATSAERFEEQSRDAENRAALLRDILLKGELYQLAE